MAIQPPFLFAWFQVSAAAQGYAAIQKSSTVSAVASSTELGLFTVTPVFKSIESDVALTTDTGTTFVYMEGDTTNEIAATASKKHAQSLFN